MNSRSNQTPISKIVQPAFPYLLAVLFSEFLDVYIAYFSAKNFSISYNLILTYMLLGIPILSAAVQASIADVYGKKSGVIIAIVVCIVGLVFAEIGFEKKSVLFVLIASGVIGTWGNIQPIAWAGLSDFITGVRLRFFLALSICFLAVGNWGGLFLAPLLTSDAIFHITIIFAAIVLLLSSICLKIKKEKRNALSIVSIVKDEAYYGNKVILLKNYNSMAYWAFALSEVAFYVIVWRIILNPGGALVYYPIAIGVGYSIGTFTINKLKKNNAVSAEFGLLVSFSSIVFMTILNFFLFYTKSGDYVPMLSFSLSCLYCFFSFGYALFTPSLFSLILPKNEKGHSGKIFGLLESVDSFSNLLSFLIVNFLFKNAALFVVYFVSSALLLFAWILFRILINKHFSELNELEEEILEEEKKFLKK